jgi:hypothetical protein
VSEYGELLSAARKRHEIESHFRVIPKVGNGRDIGSSIVEARNSMLVSYTHPILPADVSSLGRIEELRHNGAICKGSLIFLKRFHVN